MFSSRLHFDNTVCVKVTQKLSLLAITETPSIICFTHRITNTRDFSINTRHSSLLMLFQHASTINTVTNSLLPSLSLRYFYSLKWQMLLKNCWHFDDRGHRYQRWYRWRRKSVTEKLHYLQNSDNLGALYVSFLRIKCLGLLLHTLELQLEHRAEAVTMFSSE